jgi:beta-galactosidase
VFDWHAWWAQQLSDGPNRHVDYKAVMASWHAAFRRRGIDVDVVASDSSFDGYDEVAAPLLYLVRDGVAEALTAAAHRGASVWTGFLSGRVDSSDLAFLDVWPGPLKDLCGIRIDETDGRVPDWSNGVVVDGRTYDARLVFDIVATEGAEVVGTYAAGWYAGLPALTRHEVGAGRAGTWRRSATTTCSTWSWTGWPPPRVGLPLAVAGVEVSSRRQTT